MNISPADIAALKGADVLQAYCERTLGQGKRVGGKMFYPCPYGAHTRPKLETAEKDGCGVALCRACNRGGTVFDIAAGVLGVDPRKDFAACVQAVADAVGHTLTGKDDGNATKKGRRSRKAAFSARKGVLTPPAMESPAESALEYLPPDEESAALEAVRRLAALPAERAQIAQRLNLPPWIIESHTDMQECACRGLLGLDARGRLLYVYTHAPADGAPVRVLGVKTRNPQGVNPRFLMRGRKCALWGIDAAASAAHVLITEGESDALAVRAAAELYLAEWLHESPRDYPAKLPAVVAKPDAGTFKPAWARALRGKAVILITDGDAAGASGAASTADTLRLAGVRMVYKWTPPAGVKDARAAFNPAHPSQLMEDILTRKERI